MARAQRVGGSGAQGAEGGMAAVQSAFLPECAGIPKRSQPEVSYAMKAVFVQRNEKSPAI